MEETIGFPLHYDLKISTQEYYVKNKKLFQAILIWLRIGCRRRALSTVHVCVNVDGTFL